MTARARITAPPSQSSARLMAQIGYEFKNPELLAQALIHASAVGRHDRGNERLEFLGDRVLGLVIAETLFNARNEAEGDLARRLAHLVKRDALAEIAKKLHLGDYLTFAKNDQKDVHRLNANILADALEAVIAALYLDGGLETARSFIKRFWADLLVVGSAPPTDNKTKLQEWALARGLPLPAYQVVAQDGPPHAPMFDVAVRIEGLGDSQGRGPSKKVAEQGAAEAMLTRIAR